eukprot:TRINITY_DN22989_c0_g2_i1.p1 TRINITY_DN22989_c0_g2~~TRINITY_DN22989_c0_g2_i1.p1  ORF type:complete len:545 (+),score=103.28 TRINITY_DN22989_c0_g2_i1:93-1727(+)
MARKDQKHRLMASVYREACSKPQRHRLAQRPWQQQDFERLPVIACQKRYRQRREAYERGMQTQECFLQHLRHGFGSEVRAWRRELDTSSSFVLPLKELRRYCRKANLNVDSSELWKFLDKDGNGSVEFEEVCSGAADALASFHCWAHETFGSCAALWDTPALVTARQASQDLWLVGKKMMLGSFAQCLSKLGWTGASNSRMKSMLLASLDQYGCGIIERTDLQWLDAWQPPGYLCVDEPDAAAWEKIRILMLNVYKHPLLAWRFLLDKDESGFISWTEFRSACEQLGFQGNVGGAWRSLDSNLSGTISLKEFHAESAEVLRSFKEWAEQHFGSVDLTMKALDCDGSGTVSFLELKRACEKLKWSGDVRLLFDCLDIDKKRDKHNNQRSLSYEEVAFLDSWQLEPFVEASSELVQERQAPWSAPAPGNQASTLSRRHSWSSLTTKCDEVPLTDSSAKKSDDRGCRKHASPARNVSALSCEDAGERLGKSLARFDSLPDLASRLKQAYHAKRSRRGSRRRRLPTLPGRTQPVVTSPSELETCEAVK